MPSKYQDDLEARFPLNTVTITTNNSLFICTVTVTEDGAVVCRAKALSEDEAVLKARRILAIMDHEPLQGENNDTDEVQKIYDLLDRSSEFDYGNQNSAFTIDMSNGNGFEQSFTLTGSLSTGNISITLPSGPRKVTLEIKQDATGGWLIPADAWPASVNWGSKGAPTFGDGADAKRFVVLHFRQNGTIYGHYDTNVF